MNNFAGTIIEESLEDKAVLKDLNITSTKVEEVVKEHNTPWLKQWTLHKVDIPFPKAREIAERLSRSIVSDHNGSWYADFKNDKYHYVIFKNKVFFIDRTSQKQYNQAREYGISLGIPEYQVDFDSNVIK
ncbi:MAG: hypothetical protein WC666_00675 [Candidatus Paceibacterota bacterium]|jgi:hypothetical protein